MEILSNIFSYAASRARRFSRTSLFRKTVFSSNCFVESPPWHGSRRPRPLVDLRVLRHSALSRIVILGGTMRRHRSRVHGNSSTVNGLSKPFTKARGALLLGTALASTLALATPASAQAIVIFSTNSVSFTRNSNCVFTGTCLGVFTKNAFNTPAPITLTNNGDLASSALSAARSPPAFTTTAGSPHQ